jgi:hypothetical protein
MSKNGLLLLFLLLSLQLGAQSEGTVTLQKNWLTAYNAQADLSSFYSTLSGLFVEDSITTDPKLIAQRFKDLRQKWGTFSNYKTDEVFQIQKRNKIEVGTYTTADGQQYRTLIAWSIKDYWKKEFEVIYPVASDYQISETLIKQLTKDWESRSNAHRPDLIVDELYVDRGYYFNRGDVYRGSDVAKVYAYMENSDWEIELSSMSAIPCAPYTILNVGTYTSNGKGLYILLWKKELSDWKLLLDFNF